jgi:CRP/FNR family transcriptional regulator, cyclic AMP receptor protein
MTALMTALAEALRSAIWAQAWAPEEFARVQSEVIEREIPAHGYACGEGEPVSHWIGVVEGLVKLSVNAANGSKP